MEDDPNVDYEVPIYVSLLQLYKVCIFFSFKSVRLHSHTVLCMSFNSYERIQFVLHVPKCQWFPYNF